MNNSVEPIPLPLWTCFFLDSDNGTYSTSQPNLVYTCQPQGKFFIVGSPSDGHWICAAIVALIYLAGLTGIATNILNILVIPKSMCKLSGSISRLLVILAVFELLTCLFGIAFSTVILIILENISREQITFHLLKVTYALYSFGRVGFVYSSILVSIERYLVVTYPTKSKSWLNPPKRIFYFVPVLLLAILADFPYIFHSKVEANRDFQSQDLSVSSSLAKFPYIFHRTTLGQLGDSKVNYYMQLVIKCCIPVPFLLIFNGLLHRSITMWNKRRQALTNSQRREINAATMVMSVMLLLFLWNVPYFLEVVTRGDVFYREIQFMKILCFISSTTINFLMYFRSGRSFRREVFRMLGMLEMFKEKARQKRLLTR